MRTYELTYIVQSELDDSAIEDISSRVVIWIEEQGGSIKKTKNWGRRRLAYPINKQKEGIYFHFEIEIPPSSVVVLERNLQLIEDVVRFMVTSK